MSQEEIFKNQEADNWFLRNKDGLSPKEDFITYLIDLYGAVNKDSNVIELGASNGYRLAKLHEKYGCKVYAVEPSKKALEDGGVNIHL